MGPFLLSAIYKAFAKPRSKHQLGDFLFVVPFLIVLRHFLVCVPHECLNVFLWESLAFLAPTVEMVQRHQLKDSHHHAECDKSACEDPARLGARGLVIAKRRQKVGKKLYKAHHGSSLAWVIRPDFNSAVG